MKKLLNILFATFFISINSEKIISCNNKNENNKKTENDSFEKKISNEKIINFSNFKIENDFFIKDYSRNSEEYKIIYKLKKLKNINNNDILKTIKDLLLINIKKYFNIHYYEININDFDINFYNVDNYIEEKAEKNKNNEIIDLIKSNNLKIMFFKIKSNNEKIFLGETKKLSIIFPIFLNNNKIINISNFLNDIDHDNNLYREIILEKDIENVNFNKYFNQIKEKIIFMINFLYNSNFLINDFKFIIENEKEFWKDKNNEIIDLSSSKTLILKIESNNNPNIKGKIEYINVYLNKAIKEKDFKECLEKIGIETRKENIVNIENFQNDNINNMMNNEGLNIDPESIINKNELIISKDPKNFNFKKIFNKIKKNILFEINKYFNSNFLIENLNFIIKNDKSFWKDENNEIIDLSSSKTLILKIESNNKDKKIIIEEIKIELPIAISLENNDISNFSNDNINKNKFLRLFTVFSKNVKKVNFNSWFPKFKKIISNDISNFLNFSKNENLQNNLSNFLNFSILDEIDDFWEDKNEKIIDLSKEKKIIFEIKSNYNNISNNDENSNEKNNNLLIGKTKKLEIVLPIAKEIKNLSLFEFKDELNNSNDLLKFIVEEKDLKDINENNLLLKFKNFVVNKINNFFNSNFEINNFNFLIENNDNECGYSYLKSKDIEEASLLNNPPLLTFKVEYNFNNLDFDLNLIPELEKETKKLYVLILEKINISNIKKIDIPSDLFKNIKMHYDLENKKIIPYNIWWKYIYNEIKNAIRNESKNGIILGKDDFDVISANSIHWFENKTLDLTSPKKLTFKIQGKNKAIGTTEEIEIFVPSML